MENCYLPHKHKIIGITPQTAVDYTYRVAYDKTPIGGQFVEISIPGIGEAPISISDFGEGYIDMTIRNVGKVTNYLNTLKPGDFLYLRGPYGNGFDLENYKHKHLILAAGGTGLAPVKSIINYFYHHSHAIQQLDLLIGFKSSKDILFLDEIKMWQQKENFRVLLTIDQEEDDWQGNVGLITKYVPEISIEENSEVIIVGPPPMMKFTSLAFLEKVPEEKIWVSFERKMSCGIGKCGHCKIDETYVCLEGPVFNYTKAKQLMD
ncbi:anaerobic sulfite reductase subunit B [Clostridium aceticum]|uniref:Anaerobic sulfite reductase subunit B n=1 Tax=Clostridium aceticum TaxID=84022 RepID=A0A0D8IAE0_9CLOT|nr:anaerobic sulfite reductase subunit AsrB [Clostridium aceticum]AKL97157.1 anaerobic sulfite reductase subunit B [Clostridium aceticum]KJF26196.1 sulfite reductase [Clostridium aceticum]